ncbi:bifunctional helix-turn-helix transcriptional regulator/GNAT family N-acetyltransferase [Azospirillum sp.]|uniref:bifunctional helix-turn-helix transcriptional regulator/GNAT family N-acetyltransferase n=1 Tax=Azospirillum sp. TaxID=34012 RepID=UPI002D724886|nr:bifunctional helix-turn-helix transcriptional regulator/GNAT family N-acetyltransferase [Azospirillum sp.]HYD69497.1 bifunctional helix-turn-helix transcriptional regulator/GNAT family N-acetyltransferase [Azospirillum sp.]
MSDQESLQRIEAVRRFSRFYTRTVGVLHEGLLGSPFSLAEARVVYELAHHERTTANELSEELGLDPGYLSRILRGFEQRGLITRQPSEADARQNILSLTAEGWEAFADLNARSRQEIGAMLARLGTADQDRLVAAMRTIEELMGDPPPRRAPYILRPPRPGDIGWVIQRHGVLYAEDYGWGADFEALVADVAAEFLRTYDPARERCWIAEMDGQNVGCVFVVRKTDEIAKLRLLIVEPSARGHGIGARLVDECLRFARQAGYRRMTLWTNSILLPARRIYEKAGFQLVASEPHDHFGKDLIGETWERDL